MAYDEKLAQRIREALADHPEIIEKKMFGGIGYMLRGNMACGINQERLIVRVGPDRYEMALAQPHARPFDMTGRPMKGWVMVEAGGIQSDAELEAWIQQGIEFSFTLPAK